MVEIGADALPGQDLPGDPAQQDARGLADTGLDEIDVVDAVLLADPLDGRPALPGGGAVGGGQLLGSAATSSATSSKRALTASRKSRDTSVPASSR